MSRAEQHRKDEKVAKTTSNTIFQGKVFDVKTDILQFPDGTKREFNHVLHRGAVVLLPLTSDNKIILVKQWRRAAGQILLELPAGTLEEGETPEECAHRELQEEIGYKATSLKLLGEFFSTPGFTNEYLYLFLAENLIESSLIGDDTEHIDVLKVSPKEIMQMIKNGDIIDAKTICGMYFLL